MKKSLFAYTFNKDSRFFVVQTREKRLFEIDEKIYYSLIQNNISALDSKTADNFFHASVLVEDDLDEVAQLEKEHIKNDNDQEWHSLHIIPTEGCNFGCEYCFVLKDKTKQCKEEIISDDELYSGIDFFFENNPSDQVIVTFYGGEPLLAPEVIYKSIDYIENKLGKKVFKKIITNASKITPEIARFLAEHEFDVNVSLDGNKDGHDAFRVYKNGKSTYADVINGINMLQEAGNSIKLLMTVGDFNAKNLEEHVRSLLEINPTTIALNLPKALQLNDNLIEKDLNYNQLLDEYIKCVDICYEKRIPEGHMADIIFGFLRKETQFRPCHGCGKQIALAPNGLIGPCQAFIGTKKYFLNLENFNDKSELRQTEQFRIWKDISMYKSSKCRMCYLLPVCPGDCPYDWENRTGSLVNVPDTYCSSRKRMFDYMLGRLVDGKNILFRPE